MDAAAIIALIAQIIDTAIKVGPTVIGTIEDATPFAEAIYNNLIAGKAVTQADMDSLQADIDALVAEVLEPLPPDGA